MKITIDISEDELRKLGWPLLPIQIPLKQRANLQWQLNNSYEYDPCKDCLNNPKNGGSGICNCVLPYYYGPSRVTA